MAEDAEKEKQDQMDTEASDTDGWLDFKGINIFFAVIVGLAVIGFFVGTSGDPYDAQLAGFVEDTERPDRDAEPARSYTELMNDPYFKNRHWENELGELSQNRPAVTDEVQRTQEMTDRALEDRMEHRAYEGAPPTIPHPVAETGAVECMACHGDGLLIDNQIATPISHEYMTNCTQCHVVEEAGIPAPDSRYDELPVNNEFAGLERWGEGDRAYVGAPPVNPHPEHMRDDCMSCHGTVARPGLRTTHPWKTQCTQCHAPSATLNQQPAMGDLPPIGQE